MCYSLFTFSYKMLWYPNVIALVLLAFISAEVNAARILAIYPTPSISHQVVFRPYTQELVKRGHEVIVLTPDPLYAKGTAPANLTEIDVHDISYENWRLFLTMQEKQKQNIMLQIRTAVERLTSTFDLQLKTPEMKEILKKDRNYFDLIIIEACVRPTLGIIHLFDAPVIQFSSFGVVYSQYGKFGAPIHPLLYPSPVSQRIYNLTMWEKSFELFKHAMLQYLIAFTEEYDYNMMRKHFGEDVPIYDELRKKVSMLFINEYPLWADNRPVSPNIKYVGGIYQAAKTDLPKDLKLYLDSSKHGVIYVSFGTNTLPSLLPAEKIKAMTKVLSELPYDVLFKWDSEELPGHSDNIKIFKWVPQPDVLRHPKVKLFITQGGLQSTDETVDAGVPVIGIPLLADQWYNVEKFVHHKFGKQLDIQTLTESNFKNAIESVINDKSYKQNILKFRKLVKEHPILPVDHAVWWSEHLMKYGGQHLKPPSVNVNWYDYYEMNLVLTVSAIFLIILTIFVLIIRTILMLAFRIIYKTTIKLKSS